eukprot:1264885-Pleurochrysis_carterae.AAC.1
MSNGELDEGRMRTKGKKWREIMKSGQLCKIAQTMLGWCGKQTLSEAALKKAHAYGTAKTLSWMWAGRSGVGISEHAYCFGS